MKSIFTIACALALTGASARAEETFHIVQQKPELVQAMQKELIGKAEAWRSHAFDTIYFGGGTPSLLDSMELEGLLTTIYQHYSVQPNAEITLEANPDDIHAESLTQWKQFGINRLSLGIQSFANTDLEWMNRAHNAEQATQALQLALEHSLHQLLRMQTASLHMTMQQRKRALTH